METTPVSTSTAQSAAPPSAMDMPATPVREDGVEASSNLQTHLMFTGTGAEYFRIWIVHVLFTVLSLGIYSAWAKVRKARWFAQHTTLLGDPFDYHGQPRKILLGRLVALALFIAYSQSFQWSAIAGLVMVGVLLVLGPALYGAAQRFRMLNTSWRGIRFGFEASQKTLYAVCTPLVFAWTAGTVWTAFNGSPKWLLAITAASALGWPAIHASLKSTQHRQTRYGEQAFSFRPAVGSFYALYACTLGIALVGMLVAGFANLVFAIVVPKSQAPLTGFLVGITIVGLIYLVASAYFMARLQRLVWSHTRLGEVRFGSTIHATDLLLLLTGNVLLVVLTAGLYWPFAAVAIARYRVQSITVESNASLLDIAAQTRQRSTAVGDAAFDFFGLDLGW